MTPSTGKPHVDQDGVRTSTRAGVAGVSTRLLGLVLIASALAVIAVSVAAVWWLRHDVTTSVASAGAEHGDDGSLPPTIGSASTIPPDRMAGGPVRAVPLHPAAAPSAEPTGRPAKPARRAPSGSAGAPAASGSANTTAGAGSGAAEAPDEAQNAEAAREQQRDDRAIAETAEGVIAGMRAAGETKGLAAIPPRGTNPVKSGIIVPKDFALPEGYVRYYQTTDDGRRLDPILMFSPDYAFVDDQGKPLAVPKDGIVPPDMAPPGLPVRMLEVPSGSAAKPSRADGDAH